jgi:flagellar hook assembly protein FlgD
MSGNLAESIKSPSTQSSFNTRKTKDVEKKEEAPKGWFFKANLNQKNKDGKMDKMLTQSANEQIVFAQKILLQQLKNQFPGNEFDASKMVESLMGMLQIAQHSQLNETQQKSLDLNMAMMNHQLAALPGKMIEQKSDTFDYWGQDQKMVFNLSEKPAKTMAYIYKEGDTTPLFSNEIDAHIGSNSFTWRGEDNNGEKASDGIYNVFIRSFDIEGHDLNPDTRIHSEITNIDYSQGPLGIPYSGSLPLFNFNKLVTPQKPIIQTVDQSAPTTYIPTLIDQTTSLIPETVQ